MNQWHFVIAAYVAASVGVGGLIAWSWLEMRRAEARLDDANDR